MTGTALPRDLIDSIQRGSLAFRYRGIETQKSPFDLAIYTMLLHELKPATIIEIGSYMGGSAIWFADMAWIFGQPALVYSIDKDQKCDSSNRGDVRFLAGDAQDLDTPLPASLLSRLPHPWLVVEDCSHRREDTLAVLRFFDTCTAPGDYVVVEDGIMEAMGLADQFDGGPTAAIHEFLSGVAGRYVIDRRWCDYFGPNVTWNVDGYLRRI